MPLFGRKLSADQERALAEFTSATLSVNERCQEAFDELWAVIEELYWPCRDSLLHGTPLANVESPVATAREAVTSYKDVLRSAQRSLDARAPEDWYPRKSRKRYEAISKTVRELRAMADMVQQSLEPPALVPKLGKHRLNMFVSGVNVLWDLWNRQQPMA